MIRRKQTLSLLVAGALCIGAAVPAAGMASPPSWLTLTSVPTANTRSDGYAPASKLSPELAQIAVARGATRLENPSALTSYYGYDNDVLNLIGEPQMVPIPANPATEAKKTEPDKNTYLVFKHGLDGADPGYDYGTHFLFQGHEGGAGGAGYITRINLDADAEHRVTLLATTDIGGKPLTTIDGSTWDPWAKRLLFTTENQGAPTYAATPASPRPSSTCRERSAGAATRASRTTRTATSGSSRTLVARASPEPRRSVRTASSTATYPPNRVTSSTASCRRCRC